MAEPRLEKIPSHLDQVVKESQKDIPVTLPDATILIEAVKDLRATLDAQIATNAQQAAINADFEQRIFDLENP